MFNDFVVFLLCLFGVFLWLALRVWMVVFAAVGDCACCYRPSLVAACLLFVWYVCVVCFVRARYFVGACLVFAWCVPGVCLSLVWCLCVVCVVGGACPLLV